METKKQVPLEENKQPDSPASPLQKQAETKESQNNDREVRIIIIGASKSGKSTAKDVLLGKEYLTQKATASQSTSTTTTAVMAEVEKGDICLKVLDTPDIDCPEIMDEKKAREEIQKWRVMCPDPHLILLAIRCDTPDLVSDVSRFQRFRKLWGDNLRERLAVLFTFGDKMKENVDEFLSRSHPALQDVMDCAGHRYVIFDSSLSTSEQKGRAQQVFQIVKDLRNVLNVLIIGKTGNGKSSVGNSLLKTPAFSVSRGLSSSTKHTVTQSAQINGKTVTVTDTPDVSNIDIDEKAAEEEIKKWCSFDPDVILLAIRCDIRYTAEEHQIYQQIKKVLGEEFLGSRLTVAFTFGDRQDRDIDEELKTVCTELKDVLEDAGHRYIMFSNTAKKDPEHNKRDPFTRLMNSAPIYAERTRGYDVVSSLSASDQMHSDVNELKHSSENIQTELQPCGAANVETNLMPADNTRQLKVLIIGKTGNGKSSLGNRLLNSTSSFRVAPGLTSATTTAVTNSAQVHDMTVTVRDTPDISNLGVDEKAAEEEIKNWCSLHPDIILLAIRCDVRYTAEEYQIYQQIKRVLGEEFLGSRLTVAFTFGDRQDRDIDEELKTVCTELKDVLKDAKSRYIMVSKDDSEITRHGHLNRLFNYAHDHESETPVAAKKRRKECDAADSNRVSAHPVIPVSCNGADTNATQLQFEEIRIIIIGTSGSGKSTAANVLLGEDILQMSSTNNPVWPTTCQLKQTETQRPRVKVLDTPDIDFPELRDEKKAREEIQKWKAMCPDPHLILLAIRCDTPDLVSDVSRFQRFEELWGDNLKRRLVVLFTFGDRLKKSIDEFMMCSSSALHKVMDCAGHRYVIFDRSLGASEQRDRACQVFNIVNKLKNGFHVMIIGKTGNGKSTLGNSLLNTAAFSVTRGLATSTKQTVTASAQKDGLTITVADTPDVSNLGVEEKTAEEEIKKWCSFHPDIILLAIRCDIRYTAEEYQIYQQIRKVLGEEYLESRLTVAFTFGDRQDRDIDEELKTVCNELKDVLNDAGHRYIMFNKNDKEDKRHEHFLRLKKFVFNDGIPSEGITRRSKSAKKSDGNATTDKGTKLPNKGALETLHKIQVQLPGSMSRMEAEKEMKSSGRFWSYCVLL